MARGRRREGLAGEGASSASLGVYLFALLGRLSLARSLGSHTYSRSLSGRWLLSTWAVCMIVQCNVTWRQTSCDTVWASHVDTKRPPAPLDLGVREIATFRGSLETADFL